MTPIADPRLEILTRIRSILGPDAPAEDVEQAWERIPRAYRQQGSLDHSACVARFADRLHDYGAGVSYCDLAGIPSTLGHVLEQRGHKKILVSTDIDQAWLPTEGGFTFVPDDGLSYASIEDCDGVVTGSKLAIAETGTLALCHGAEGNGAGYDGRKRGQEDRQENQGRRVLTLLPDYYLCIVRTLDIVETVPEAIQVLEPIKAQPLTLISGPSATADIEMTRIQGVHGPRTLDVLIVD